METENRGVKREREDYDEWVESTIQEYDLRIKTKMQIRMSNFFKRPTQDSPLKIKNRFLSALDILPHEIRMNIQSYICNECIFNPYGSLKVIRSKIVCRLCYKNQEEIYLEELEQIYLEFYNRIGFDIAQISDYINIYVDGCTKSEKNNIDAFCELLVKRLQVDLGKELTWQIIDTTAIIISKMCQKNQAFRIYNPKLARTCVAIETPQQVNQ